jgi:hypothetical protein
MVMVSRLFDSHGGGNQRKRLRNRVVRKIDLLLFVTFLSEGVVIILPGKNKC